jgi:hypothetical protein
MRPAPRLFAAVLLAAGCGGVGAPAVAQDPAVPPGVSLNPLSALDLESLAATRQLPLFTPSRSAPVIEPPVEPEIVAVEPEIYVEPEPVPPAFRLVGVVMTESDQVALLADQATGTIHRLRAGESYDGWTLNIVDGRTVAFVNDGREHTLTMFEDFSGGTGGGGGDPIGGEPTGGEPMVGEPTGGGGGDPMGGEPTGEEPTVIPEPQL